MHKKFLTVALILTICILAGVAINQIVKKNHKTTTQQSEITTVKEADDTDFPYAEGKKILTHKAVSNQICEMNTCVRSEDGIAIEEYEISTPSISKELPSRFSISDTVRNRFGSDVMTEDRTLLNDFCYLTVHIKLKNLWQGAGMLNPSGFSYVLLNRDDTILGSEYGDYSYRGAIFESRLYDAYETDGKNIMTLKNTPISVENGAECECDIVFIIPQLYIEEFDICIVDTLGGNPQAYLNKQDWKYVKLDLREVTE